MPVQPRPDSLPSITHRIATSHGTLFLTVTIKGKGKRAKPFEVFGSIGKSGQCDRATIESICRLASLHLRSRGNIADIIDQLQGITCEPMWTDGVLVRSIPDAIAWLLRHFVKETV